LRILITGGAGYIGSHTAMRLAQAGFDPIGYDNLSTGHRWAVKWGPLVEADLCDRAALQRALKHYNIEGAIHFAAHAYVAESMREPRRFFQNNVTCSLNLLDALLDAGVKNIVFSSSCAVYGVPDSTPIAENHPKLPVNPYGESKLFIERALGWYGQAYDMRWAALRYFNAAGADPGGEIGEVHSPETHLLPLVIETAMGRRDFVEIYGTDYPTPDGTAVRDYIHVTDLAEAHLLALRHLIAGGQSLAVNLGTGCGVSIREAVASVEAIAGKKINAKPAPRRPGDPPALVADPTQAANILGWQPKFSTLESIVATAWRWHNRVSSPDHARSGE
jgi:UDP-glucose-4-epimerase GalE